MCICATIHRATHVRRLCSQRNRTDANNFDKDFTKEDPCLTPLDQQLVDAINQNEFDGFSYVNADFGQMYQLGYGNCCSSGTPAEGGSAAEGEKKVAENATNEDSAKSVCEREDSTPATLNAEASPALTSASSAAGSSPTLAAASGSTLTAAKKTPVHRLPSNNNSCLPEAALASADPPITAKRSASGSPQP